MVDLIELHWHGKHICYLQHIPDRGVQAFDAHGKQIGGTFLPLEARAVLELVEHAKNAGAGKKS
jgi:hypothetical protein